MSQTHTEGRRPGAFARWMYRTGHPNRLAAAMNRGWAILGSLGVWRSRLLVLEVRGRRTGRPVTFPLVWVRYEGERYLVSMLGAHTSWVANVRAAGGHAVIRQRGRQPVVLQEVPVAQRAPVLRAYLHRAPGGRPHIPVDRHAPVADFVPIAADYPVFRITPDSFATDLR
jgi:deazaflavin-dependent oxidoreductase (nitroreductase family)